MTYRYVLQDVNILSYEKSPVHLFLILAFGIEGLSKLFCFLRILSAYIVGDFRLWWVMSVFEAKYAPEAISRPAVVLGSWVALLACSLLIFLAFSAQQAALR